MSDTSDFLAEEKAKTQFQAELLVKAQVRRLRLNFPDKRWEADDFLEEIDGEITVMVNEFGADRLEQTITAAIRNLTFLPRIAELRSLVPPPPRKPNQILAELKELEMRRAAGEKFYGLRELAQAMKEKFPDINAAKVIAAGSA